MELHLHIWRLFDNLAEHNAVSFCAKKCNCCTFLTEPILILKKARNLCSCLPPPLFVTPITSQDVTPQEMSLPCDLWPPLWHIYHTPLWLVIPLWMSPSLTCHPPMNVTPSDLSPPMDVTHPSDLSPPSWHVTPIDVTCPHRYHPHECRHPFLWHVTPDMSPPKMSPLLTCRPHGCHPPLTCYPLVLGDDTSRLCGQISGLLSSIRSSKSLSKSGCSLLLLHRGVTSTFFNCCTQAKITSRKGYHVPNIYCLTLHLHWSVESSLQPHVPKMMNRYGTTIFSPAG